MNHSLDEAQSWIEVEWYLESEYDTEVPGRNVFNGVLNFVRFAVETSGSRAERRPRNRFARLKRKSDVITFRVARLGATSRASASLMFTRNNFKVT